MGKQKQILKPDIILKNYWRNNEQFADFFNAVLFEGEQRIRPDELGWSLYCLEWKRRRKSIMECRCVSWGMIMAHTKSSMMTVQENTRQQKA